MEHTIHCSYKYERHQCRNLRSVRDLIHKPKSFSTDQGYNTRFVHHNTYNNNHVTVLRTIIIEGI